MSTNIPKVGSLWKARDGRIVEVTRVDAEAVRPWASVRLLSQCAKSQKETSVFGLFNFGDFLQPLQKAASTPIEAALARIAAERDAARWLVDSLTVVCPSKVPSETQASGCSQAAAAGRELVLA